MALRWWFKLCVRRRERDGTSVTIGLPQDPGQAGRAQVLYLTKGLAGFRVVSSRESGSKETRAMPVASQVNAGYGQLAPWCLEPRFPRGIAGFPRRGRKTIKSMRAKVVHFQWWLSRLFQRNYGGLPGARAECPDRLSNAKLPSFGGSWKGCVGTVVCNLMPIC